MGKGILNEKGDWALGMLGMFGVPAANIAIQKTDLFVAFGIRWDDRVSQKVGESGLEADIAYIDVNYAEKNDIQLDIGEWQDYARQLKDDHQLDFDRQTSAIQQAEVMALLSTHITEDTKITTGVGNHQMFAAQHLLTLTPKSFITSGGYGTMGFALPAAIGAQYANPEAIVIAIDGDGSLLMNLGELFTIGKYELPVKVLMLNNHGDCMVRNIQDIIYDRSYVGTKKITPVSFANVAGEMGFRYHCRVEDRKDLKSSVKAFIDADGPAFLEVVTDVDEILYPRIPAGLGYSDMILGPHMEK